MSDFINKNTKEIVFSGHDPLFKAEDGWVQFRRADLPRCNPIHMKFVNDVPVEMTSSEKAAVDASLPKRVKRKEEVMHEIFVAIPGAEFLTFLDACDKHPSFVFALEMGAIEVAKGILEKAKFRASISEAHYQIIKSILEG